MLVITHSWRLNDRYRELQAFPGHSGNPCAAWQVAWLNRQKILLYRDVYIAVSLECLIHS